MNKINVELLNYTPLKIADIAIGTCWDKQKCDNEIDYARMDRVVNKFKHQSTIEHIYYNFNIKNISRAVLQELVRHRISSFSVKSTRYTLKELKNIEEAFCSYGMQNAKLKIYVNEKLIKQASKFIVITGIKSVDIKSISALEQLRLEIRSGTSNDVSKYCLPESYRTELMWSINARSLKNFLNLRTDKAALKEIRILAHKAYNVMPDEHKFIFENDIKEQ